MALNDEEIMGVETLRAPGSVLDQGRPLVWVRRSERPRTAGKFLQLGSEKLWVRGVTYGTLRPDAHGREFHDPQRVEQDFARMAASGINAIRTYTVPPRWLLDAAERRGLAVMVGIPWEQHVAFLESSSRARSIEARVRAGVRACARHPAVLCYAIGNEIPAPIVRWHGRRAIERFLHRLYEAAKAEDPGGLVTYVNYPSTEYLDLPFIDLVCFNVYLETRERLEAYVARLQNLAGDRPVMLGEIGLDSRRHGEATQARVLDWQVRVAFRAGCAGAFVFAWTDEWHRGGHDIVDWDFGLTDRDGQAKPALTAVRHAFAEVPAPKGLPWPRISVVVCSYNGARTIRDCLEGLLEVEYPNFEVIVVDDGSTDETAAIARSFGYRVVSTPNRGLSNARNTGLRAASGDIVAYTDDDARPDPHWLTYLALTFLTTPHAGVGGPNIAPPGDGAIAECVANAPGGPVHVLLGDREAEHIPGCNMAFRRECLEAIDGFDPRFRAAGDDVDVCWRISERGWTLGFNAAAMVWHHRRNSLRAYWRQQLGYGQAEAMLEAKWPEKYNAAGHLRWSGLLYGKGITAHLGVRRERVYQGTWGSALFQSVYQRTPGVLASLPLMPEWWLVVVALAVMSVLGAVWPAFRLALPLLALAVAAPVAQATRSARRAAFPGHGRSTRATLRIVTALLHLVQPMARLRGRLKHGLTPWRRLEARAWLPPLPRQSEVWSEYWRSAVDRLHGIERELQDAGATVLRGGDFDRWDLEVRGGPFGAARTRLAIEEHGAGRQLTRFRTWARWSKSTVVLLMFSAAITAAVLVAGRPLAGMAPAAIALWVATRAIWEAGSALAMVSRSVESSDAPS